MLTGNREVKDKVKIYSPSTLYTYSEILWVKRLAILYSWYNVCFYHLFTLVDKIRQLDKPRQRYIDLPICIHAAAGVVSPHLLWKITVQPPMSCHMLPADVNRGSRPRPHNAWRLARQYVNSSIQRFLASLCVYTLLSKRSIRFNLLYNCILWVRLWSFLLQ